MIGRKKTTVELTRLTEDEYRLKGKLPLSLLADNVRSMQNIGSMFRTADAFLVKEIILGGISGIPPHPEISKTALGAEDNVAWQYVDDCVAYIEVEKRNGKRIAVLEQTHGSIDLSEFNPMLYSEDRDTVSEWILVVGNEVEGVDQRIVDLADVALEIRMDGLKHSLNVAVSTGIALWQFRNLLSL